MCPRAASAARLHSHPSELSRSADGESSPTTAEGGWWSPGCPRERGVLSSFETLMTRTAEELPPDMSPPWADTGHPHTFGCGAAEGIATQGGKSKKPSGEPGGAGHGLGHLTCPLDPAEEPSLQYYLAFQGWRSCYSCLYQATLGLLRADKVCLARSRGTGSARQCWPVLMALYQLISEQLRRWQCPATPLCLAGDSPVLPPGFPAAAVTCRELAGLCLQHPLPR